MKRNKQDNKKSEKQEAEEEQVKEELKEGYEPILMVAPKDFKKGPWTDPSNVIYSCGKHHQALFSMVKSLSNVSTELENIEAAFVTLTDDKPSNYKEAMHSHNAKKWIKACKHEYNLIMRYGTWDLVDAPLDTNIVGS